MKAKDVAIDDDGVFSANYAQARQRFLELAAAATMPVASFEHPLRGREGEVLATDIVRSGPPDATRALVVTSATHGVEGLCGSGIQCALLADQFAARLPDGVALVLVHALNPFGFSWLRRTNEDNVDLNRNGRDFGRALEPNPAYEEVHALLVPGDWGGPEFAAAELKIEAYKRERGERAWQAAVSGGQYTHPDGLFYGGREASWSNRTIRALCREHLAGFEQVGVLDLHTGLGPRGHGELIYAREPGDSEHRRLIEWLGDDVTSVADGSSTSAPVVGTIDALFRAELGQDRVTFAVIEYGTLPIDEVLAALRMDNWVHLHGQVDSELGREAKRRMVAAFVGEDPAWRRSVEQRARSLAERMAAGLAAL
ncbi:M14 family metallopeptidase [Engelhardtia mirabilis]|uniref:DUF2817 domain-containing protein n=1 Tax=Engelhardtia mirabilis TaxID=2528011 RepID=A0A518BF08_9BACT|nr:hypothetical protein Pla133_06320 [Planctomycetes bacterium Pla133]QDU99892.1 hypothetical protein Pla86_06310 [Planctomycetes bacterium Pla86]